MTSQADPPDDMRWLLEPPSPGAVQVYIAAGEGAIVSAEVREAIDKLMNLLLDSDVQGMAAGPRMGTVGGMRTAKATGCDINCMILSRCNPEYQTPCFSKDVCNIIPCPDYRWSVTRIR